MLLNLAGIRLVLYIVNHKILLDVEARFGLKITKQMIIKMLRGQEIITKKCIKGVRANVFHEVAPDKILIYSFTHNTFAVINCASAAVEIASCRLDGLKPNTVVEIVFTEPPTHFFYRDRSDKTWGLPVKIIMNEA